VFVIAKYFYIFYTLVNNWNAQNYSLSGSVFCIFLEILYGEKYAI
jgi:hypothetical protein